MSWEQSGKPQNVLDPSAEEAREQVIEKYHTTLSDLEEAIKAAQAELDALNKDIGGIHEARLKEYADKDTAFQNAAQLDAERKQELQSLSDDLEKRRQLLSQAIENENARVSSHNTGILARNEQLSDLSEDLNQRKTDLDKKARDLDNVASDLSNQRAQISQTLAQMDNERAMLKQESDRLVERENAVAAKEADYAQRVSAVQLAEAKNLDVAAALMRKQTEIEPLKAQYEAGIAKNQEEEKRLRDENIRLYKINTDAEVKQRAANEAVIKAQEATGQLETLKADIDRKIKVSEVIDQPQPEPVQAQVPADPVVDSNTTQQEN